jgi:hypothetical protein
MVWLFPKPKTTTRFIIKSNLSKIQQSSHQFAKQMASLHSTISDGTEKQCGRLPALSAIADSSNGVEIRLDDMLYTVESDGSVTMIIESDDMPCITSPKIDKDFFRPSPDIPAADDGVVSQHHRLSFDLRCVCTRNIQNGKVSPRSHASSDI